MEDKTDFIKKTKVNRITDGSYSVLLNVWSLYTNIPHIQGIEALRNYLQKSKPYMNKYIPYYHIP